MKKLQEKDYIKAAALLNCEVAVIKAVAEVESRGGGFDKNGIPKILFEGHWFYRFTDGKYGNTFYSYPKWIRKYYNMNQHKRLREAVKKDRKAALKSTSWGMFQIMGFNHKKCGFKSVQNFVNAMFRTEGYHLMAFCNFVKNIGLDDELREKRWAEFAYRYNGAGYKINKYDSKLKKAYLKYKNIGL